MNFVFSKGVGYGSFSTDEFDLTGSIKNIAFDKEVLHSKCEFWFKNGRIIKTEYEEGIILSRVFTHQKETWRFIQEGEFELDQYNIDYLVKGTYSGSDPFHSHIAINVKNRVGTGWKVWLFD